MARLEFRLPLPGVSRRQLWEFHRDPKALLLLTPPDKKVRLVEQTDPMGEGAKVVLRVTQFGLPLTWVSRIPVWEPPKRFVDVQEKGPFRSWRHEHLFEDGLLVDLVDYEVALVFLGGGLVDRAFVRKDLERMFAHRHAVTRRELIP